jgi:hypothetical protein
LRVTNDDIEPGPFDPVEHAHKEIVPTSKVIDGNYHPRDATTFDDLCSETRCKKAIHIPTGKGGT